MNVAKLLAWGIALTLVALPIVGVLNGWFASERWPVDRLAVRAEFNHVSAEQIRAAAQPLLGKGFFAIDLDQIRAAVAKLPWVERVEARKRWPDAVDLIVYEQQPYARWGEERLLNRRGEIFSVTGAGGVQGLPRLAGPDERVGDVLQFYAESLKEFSGSGLAIAAVALSPRGGWKLELATGAVIEIGRDDAKRRLARFLDVWPNLAGSKPTPPVYVDLRYENGFVVRWSDPAPPTPPAGSREPGAGHAEGQPTANPQALLHGADRPSVRTRSHAAADFQDSIPDLRPFRIPNPESRIPALS
ncbi:cell division protein FtsQ/DivIB [Dokdonella sp.]|uniref:cell division protein FtsQ/DivIB n=1 Tax=Dokdonella sp. TaxID=2291710 RepID=UPI001B280A36|nr:cell division protein FtsQ/DivIB [Dokdonella sp.]MBO9665063.1 cell division protein FtsQ/DivIB [Dokdonella sp.]